MKTVALLIALLASGASVPVLGVTTRDVGVALIFLSVGVVIGLLVAASHADSDETPADTDRRLARSTSWDGGPR